MRDRCFKYLLNIVLYLGLNHFVAIQIFNGDELGNQDFRKRFISGLNQFFSKSMVFGL